MFERGIRQATLKDFDFVLALLRQLWPDKELNSLTLRSVFTHCLDSNDCEYFVAEIEGKVVGFCSLTIKNSLWQEGYMGHIPEMVVDSPFRGQGIGTDLLKKAIDYATEKGCKRIELDSAFHREEAHRFYEGMGFEKRAFLFSKEVAIEH